MKAIIVFLGICTLFGNVFSVKFPNEVPRCKPGDEECIVKSANLMLKHFATVGNPNINLLALDPLVVPHISIEQGEESPVNVLLKFDNNKVIGLSKADIYKIKGFDGNIDQKYEVRLKAPIIQLVGPYSINGRVLILPIQGVGQSNLTILDPDFTILFDGKSVEKKNKKYLRVENTKLTFTISKLIFNLGNLYNGDKLLGDGTNLFLNENWRDVFNEINKSVFDAFSQIVENVLNNIFQKVPYDELFAKN